MAPTLAASPASPRSAARPHTEAVQLPLASCAERRATRHGEVVRDAQVVADASMAELGNCLRGALGITAGLPPPARAPTY